MYSTAAWLSFRRVSGPEKGRGAYGVYDNQVRARCLRVEGFGAMGRWLGGRSVACREHVVANGGMEERKDDVRGRLYGSV